MQLDRLRGRKICDQLLRKGMLWKGKHFQVRYAFGHPRHPAAKLGHSAVYVGTLASTRLSKKAVERNRMRRRIREALRTSLLPLKDFPTVQLLILPRSSSLKCPFSEIQADALFLLKTLGHPRSFDSKTLHS